MQPDQPEPDKQRPLPPELAFLNELGNRPPMEREEVPAWARGLLQKIHDNAALMREHGLNPDRMINNLLPLIENMEKTQREYDEVQEKFLHSAAEVADAARAAVDSLEILVKHAAEEKPFDPQVQEWIEELEELRKQYPKID